MVLLSRLMWSGEMTEHQWKHTVAAATAPKTRGVSRTSAHSSSSSRGAAAAAAAAGLVGGDPSLPRRPSSIRGGRGAC